jgi:hypothetical protein
VLGQPGDDRIAAGLMAAAAIVDRIAGHRAAPDLWHPTSPSLIAPEASDNGCADPANPANSRRQRDRLRRAPRPGRTTTSIPRGVPTTPRRCPSISPPRARCP